MNYSIKSFIRREGLGYVADCPEVADAVVRGTTLDETVEKLRHEISRLLCASHPSTFGLVEEPTLFITFEDVPLPGRMMESPVNCINL